MAYLYLATIPAIVGGLAAFLKLRNPWAKAAGLALFAIGLFAMLYVPVLWRQPAAAY